MLSIIKNEKDVGTLLAELTSDAIEVQSIKIFWNDIPYERLQILYPNGEEREIGMNFLWPIPTGQTQNLTQADADQLTGPFALVYVEFLDTWGLALTAGGTDLSWEICEAYIQLGFLPPADMCHLPVDGKWTLTKEMIPRACQRSLSVLGRWLEGRSNQLNRVKKIIKNQA